MNPCEYLATVNFLSESPTNSPPLFFGVVPLLLLLLAAALNSTQQTQQPTIVSELPPEFFRLLVCNATGCWLTGMVIDVSMGWVDKIFIKSFNGPALRNFFSR